MIVTDGLTEHDAGKVAVRDGDVGAPRAVLTGEVEPTFPQRNSEVLAVVFELQPAPTLNENRPEGSMPYSVVSFNSVAMATSVAPSGAVGFLNLFRSWLKNMYVSFRRLAHYGICITKSQYTRLASTLYA